MERAEQKERTDSPRDQWCEDVAAQINNSLQLGLADRDFLWLQKIICRRVAQRFG